MSYKRFRGGGCLTPPPVTCRVNDMAGMCRYRLLLPHEQIYIHITQCIINKPVLIKETVYQNTAAEYSK